MDFEIDSAASANVGSTTVVNAADLEAEPGRSSASNSASDSESDVELDDSASDRSDGSDCSGYNEPFTAARVMTLNRLQQQQHQRREQFWQSRAALAAAAASSRTSATQFDYRPPPDSEYQSGDSIDSTMAEDSGGSDSSSSDLCD